MILASQFESLLHPFRSCSPFRVDPVSRSESGGGTETRSTCTRARPLVLFGVVKKNSILQVDHMNKLREGGMPRSEAIMQANSRPLASDLMTTLALVAGMLPLWVEPAGRRRTSHDRRGRHRRVNRSACLTLIMTPVAYPVRRRGKRRALAANCRVFPSTGDCGGAPNRKPQAGE